MFLSFLNDFNLILQIFLILAIIAFVRRRVTSNTLSLILITGAVVIMIFIFWPIFRVGYIFYILLSVGVAGILVDFFFITGHRSPEASMDQKMNTFGTPGATEAYARNQLVRRTGRRR